jgi:hypothetical protein
VSLSVDAVSCDGDARMAICQRSGLFALTLKVDSARAGQWKVRDIVSDAAQSIVPYSCTNPWHLLRALGLHTPGRLCRLVRLQLHSIVARRGWDYKDPKFPGKPHIEYDVS